MAQNAHIPGFGSGPKILGCPILCSFFELDPAVHRSPKSHNAKKLDFDPEEN